LHLLTLSSPVVSNGCTSQCLGPYWSNPPFSVLAPEYPNVKKLKGWVRPVRRWTLW